MIARAHTRSGEPVHFGNDPGRMPGPENTYQSYGTAWANLSNTPFRLYKHWIHEGGISTPLIVHWPDGIARAGRHPPHAGLPARHHGHDPRRDRDDYPQRVARPRDRAARRRSPRAGVRRATASTAAADVLGARGQRRGAHRPVEAGARYPGAWELYDMEADRTELHDLAAQHPERVADMARQYDAWAARCGVIPREKIVALMKSQGVTRAFWEKDAVTRGRRREAWAHPAAGRRRRSAAPPASTPRATAAIPLRRPTPAARLVRDPGGTFTMGNDGPDAVPGDGEGPARRVTLGAYRIAATTVTNAEFAAFVRATRYVTDAERLGTSFVFYLQVPARARRPRSSRLRPAVVGAGRGCVLAAAGGAGLARSRPRPNTRSCTCRGTTRRRTAPGPGRGCPPKPSGSAPRAAASRAGASRGATSCSTPTGCRGATYFAATFRTRRRRAGSPRRSPRAPARPTAWACTTSAAMSGSGVPTSSRRPRPLRGGSFLCHDSYCNRYRVAARSANTGDTATSHIGFRVRR